MPRRDLVFLHGRCWPACDARVDKRFDGYHTLQFMAAGGVDLYYDDRRFELAGPTFWTAYPGPRVRFGPAVGRGHRTWRHRYVAFTGPLVGDWVAEGLFPRQPQPMPEARSRAAYERRFDELIEQALRGDRWGTLRATVLLEGLLVELAEARADARAASGGGGSERWLERVRAALAEAPANDAAAANDPLDYERLADACGMALSTLRRRFRRATGTPLHAYALQCRAAAARRLLGETDLPIKAVAARLGYRDVYFFTKQFRRLTGVPPAAYRRSRQG